MLWCCIYVPEKIRITFLRLFHFNMLFQISFQESFWDNVIFYSHHYYIMFITNKFIEVGSIPLWQVFANTNAVSMMSACKKCFIPSFCRR